MLVLTRKVGEAIRVGSEITIRVKQLDRQQVQIEASVAGNTTVIVVLMNEANVPLGTSFANLRDDGSTT